jgi:hypothetical protein
LKLISADREFYIFSLFVPHFWISTKTADDSNTDSTTFNLRMTSDGRYKTIEFCVFFCGYFACGGFWKIYLTFKLMSDLPSRPNEKPEISYKTASQ